MFHLAAAACCLLVSVVSCGDLDFPPGFRFGVATAAYQIEGAWNVSGKCPSIWDHYTHTYPDAVSDRSNGDVACDSYHKWREDVEQIANLGAHFYRFSISWPRLLPTGFPNKICKDGVEYYNQLIDGLLEMGIKPVVTLYHWDLPQNLQELGGWANPLVSDWFADYARVVYSLYADRVKSFMTINEPLMVCDLAYNGYGFAPNILDTERLTYICSKNVLLAHAKAYRVYDEQFRYLYHGQVLLANHLIWFIPQSPEDEEVTELVREYVNGRFSHPIYSEEGGWPPMIERIIAEKSKAEGHLRSRLPPFTQEERVLIRGSHDNIYGFNHYVSRLVRKAKPNETIGMPTVWGVSDLGVQLENDPSWGSGSTASYSINPEGLRYLGNWLKSKYGNLRYIITENGIGSSEYGLADDYRIQYIHDFLNQTLQLIRDGVNVTDYTAWSLMDNFEWVDGYSAKYGLYQVDFNDPQRKRKPRKSAHYYKRIICKNSLNVRR